MLEYDNIFSGCATYWYKLSFNRSVQLLSQMTVDIAHQSCNYISALLYQTHFDHHPKNGLVQWECSNDEELNLKLLATVE